MVYTKISSPKTSEIVSAFNERFSKELFLPSAAGSGTVYFWRLAEAATFLIREWALYDVYTISMYKDPKEYSEKDRLNERTARPLFIGCAKIFGDNEQVGARSHTLFFIHKYQFPKRLQQKWDKPYMFRLLCHTHTIMKRIPTDSGK